MSNDQKINLKTLIENAKTSQHQEAYITLDKTQNYKIGIGARTKTNTPPTLFIEILINLCPSLTKANLTKIEKSLYCLKQLKAKNYTLTCQDDNSISCEKTLSNKNITQEYQTIKTLFKTNLET